jgi:hypothetical protein
MRSRYQIREAHAAHFVTSTIVEWLPVFTTGACCDILVEAMKYCREHKGLLVHAGVIMDNHFHAEVAVETAKLLTLKHRALHDLVN